VARTVVIDRNEKITSLCIRKLQLIQDTVLGLIGNHTLRTQESSDPRYFCSDMVGPNCLDTLTLMSERQFGPKC